MTHSTTRPRLFSAGRLPLLAALAAGALLLTGCVENTEGAAPTGEAITVERSDAAAKLLPADVADAGVLRVGVHAGYAPNQYAGSDGEPVGWEVELVDAIGDKLGLDVEWSKMSFDQIIPQVNGGTLDMGSSSFSDTTERQKTVDFVDFYEAGLQFARNADEEPMPDDLCGLKIGLQATTTADAYLMEKSDECVAAGNKPIELIKKDHQDDVTNDLMMGNVPYMLADSPIAQYSAKVGEGKIELDGDLFDASPYGLVFDKDSELAEAARVALQEMIDDGTYEKILAKWGVEGGAVDEAVINGVK